MNFVILLVIAGATGMLERRVKEKFGSHSSKTFNRLNAKTSMLGTSHIIREVLQFET